MGPAPPSRSAVPARVGRIFPGRASPRFTGLLSQVDAVVLEPAVRALWQCWLPALGPLALGRQNGVRQSPGQPSGVTTAGGLPPRKRASSWPNARSSTRSRSPWPWPYWKGWIVTGDAKFTQKTIVATIIAHGGAHVLIAKDKQPTLFSDPTVVAEALTTTRRRVLHGSRNFRCGCRRPAQPQ